MSSTVLVAPEKVLTFRIGRQHYALPLDAVGQVVRLPDLTDIVGASQHLAGMLNLRGQFLPVLDGHALFGVGTPYSLESSILIITREGAPVFGMLADEVEAVEPTPAAGIADLDNGAPFMSGIMRPDERSIIVLDPVALHQLIASSNR